MEINKILQADILDLLFEGRNKDYGAYDLRKTYNRRMYKALLVVALLMVSLWLGYALSKLNSGGKKQTMAITDYQLEDVSRLKNDPPPPPLPKPKPIQVATIPFTPPRIVIDREVKPEEAPPEQKDMDDVKIGDKKVEGVADDGSNSAPVAAGTGVVEAPKDNTDYGGVFTKVEVESFYPGGEGAWARFLYKNFRYPDEAQNNGIQGTVVVKFIVDQEGNVSNIEAISGPTEGGLRDEAVRVIKKSGKWTPAIQNGRQVKSYKSQSIVFKSADSQ